MIHNPVRDILHERFPQCFAGRGEPKRPLAIDIKNEIAKACPDLIGHIESALRDYTGGPTYQTACVAGAVRINLHGLPDGIVTPSHAQYHQGRLAALKLKWIAQRAKEEQREQRLAAGLVGVSD